MTLAGAPVVQARALAKTYANGTQALLPLDLDVRQGEFVTLLGPSGCGKSTLLRLMAGLLAPSAGSLSLWGRAPGQVGGHASQRLSFVFQDATLMPWGRVLANVRLPLDLAGVPRAQADAQALQALQRVGLEGFAHHRPRELSGGMQMRVSIARGLVTQPQLLLMDEPFGALDEITRHRLDADLRALWGAQGFTAVFVTHSIAEAVFLSTRVLVMAARPGRVVDDVAIEHDGPRDAAWRVSDGFNAHARRLQDSLLRASARALAA